MNSPSKQNFIDTAFEILDERDWNSTDWNSADDRADFMVLLAEAWDRAAKHETENPKPAMEFEYLCGRCGQPYEYPVGCTPTECLEGK